MPRKIRGLATLVTVLKAVCKVIDKFGLPIREFVPENRRTEYDNALAAIRAACVVIRSIDYSDNNSSTNPVWGQ